MAEFGITSQQTGQAVRLPKAVAVKNKQPSDRQITAEQLLREAHTIQIETEFNAPKQTITDPEELEEYRCVPTTQNETSRKMDSFLPFSISFASHLTYMSAPYAISMRPATY